MNYKKPAIWVIAGALILCCAVTVFGIAESKTPEPSELDPGVSVTGTQEPEQTQNSG